MKRLLPPLVVLLGCAGADDDSAPPSLPALDSDAEPAPDTGGFPIDTSPDTGRDEQPAHTLTIEQVGLWSLAPFGGPYTSLVGELSAIEYLDGQRPPDSGDTGAWDEAALVCEVRYALVGAPVAEPCPGCDFAFAISFYVTEGDPSACRDPDIPLHDEVRVFGYSEADGTIYHDLGGLGLWLPWYAAARAGDDVEFSYVDTWGVALPDEEDE